MEKNKKLIWISYDLGPGGDYEGLYYWLDHHGAKECGDSVAALWFSYTSDLAASLKKSLKEVALRAKDRVYVIYQKSDGSPAGKFIFGGRKVAPWKGYAEIGEEGTEDEAKTWQSRS